MRRLALPLSECSGAVVHSSTFVGHLHFCEKNSAGDQSSHIPHVHRRRSRYIFVLGASESSSTALRVLWVTPTATLSVPTLVAVLHYRCHRVLGARKSLAYGTAFRSRSFRSTSAALWCTRSSSLHATPASSCTVVPYSVWARLLTGLQQHFRHVLRVLF